MKISMICAIGKRGELGQEQDLPWNLPEDLKHFKHTTLGKPVLMGLRTHKSIGKPLPGRRNIVLSFEPCDLPGCEVYTSIEDALATITEEEVLVMGGASIYKQLLPKAEKLYITYIDHAFEADTFFPDINWNDWELVSNKKGTKDERNPYDYYFREYERKQK